MRAAGATGAAPVAIASGATLLAGEGFYAESIQMAEKAEAPALDRLKREAALHLPMQQLGEIATRAGVAALVVTRLQPAPLFEAQYQTAVGATFEGPAVIADECEEIAP